MRSGNSRAYTLSLRQAYKIYAEANSGAAARSHAPQRVITPPRMITDAPPPPGKRGCGMTALSTNARAENPQEWVLIVCRPHPYSRLSRKPLMLPSCEPRRRDAATAWNSHGL
jgi:hypothetical protein